ncbi:MAG: hypothetical protein L0154_21955 [Chloroflexi bacterium]|nr:hypothetical protein [Chloroflexota bacterium]
MQFLENLGNHVGGWGRARRIAMVAFITLFASVAIGLPVLLAQVTGSAGLGGDSPVPAYLLLFLAFLIYLASFAVIAGFDRSPDSEHKPGMVGGILVLLGIIGFIAFWVEIVWWIFAGNYK